VNLSGRRGYTVRTPFSVWKALGFLLQDTVMGRRLQPSGRCPPQGKLCIQSSTVRTSVFMVRTIKHHGNCVHQFNRLDVSLQGPDTQSLIMVITCSWTATVRTLGQAIQTPFGILFITFYSNIGFGRNWRRWKANKKYCKLMVWKAPVQTEKSSVLTALPKFENFSELLFGHGNNCPSGCACQRLYFLLELGLLKPINKGF